MEQRLRFFQNGMLRKIFGPERNEVNRERRRLYNKEIYDLYSSPNVIWVAKSRRMRRAGHIAHMGDIRGANGFGGKAWSIETTGRSIWEDNIKMDLQANTDHSHDSRTTK